jgi:glycine/serine hydroxymethyltransferase
VADLLAEALHHRENADALELVRGKVRELTKRFPLPS